MTITQKKVVVSSDEMQLEVIEQNESITTLNTQALQLLADAQNVKVVDQDSDTRAVEIVLRAKALRKAYGAERHTLTDPLERTKKAFIAWFSAHDAPLANVESTVGAKHMQWERDQREAARREQERLQKLADARNAKAAAKAEAKGEEPPPVVIPPPTVQAPPKTVKTAAGTLTTKTTWTFEVTDLSALPDEYKLADTARLGKVVRAGIRQIPGVRIFETETLGGRS